MLPSASKGAGLSPGTQGRGETGAQKGTSTLWTRLSFDRPSPCTPGGLGALPALATPPHAREPGVGTKGSCTGTRMAVPGGRRAKHKTRGRRSGRPQAVGDRAAKCPPASQLPRPSALTPPWGLGLHPKVLEQGKREAGHTSRAVGDQERLGQDRDYLLASLGPSSMCRLAQGGVQGLLPRALCPQRGPSFGFNIYQRSAE